MWDTEFLPDPLNTLLPTAGEGGQEGSPLSHRGTARKWVSAIGGALGDDGVGSKSTRASQPGALQLCSQRPLHLVSLWP